MDNANHQYTVNIVDFKETPIAVLEHHGDPATVLNSVKVFIAWRKINKLPPSVSRTFNIFYQDLAALGSQSQQIDLCVATNKKVVENEQGVISKILPAGRCAVLRHIGSDYKLTSCFDFLYGQWLAQSGEQLRDFPAFIERITFYPEVTENEMITDLYLPLQ
jgi:AraC family transcriptional regulator